MTRPLIIREGVPAPDPAQLAADSAKVLPRPQYAFAETYGESIFNLRNAGMTWREVREWLAERGAEFTDYSLKRGLAEFCERQGRTEP